MHSKNFLVVNKMNQQRVVDYIFQYLYDLGIEDVFTLTGGGAMFLNDGIISHGRMNAICNHHEQACAMAAVGYAKYRNDFAAVVITSGCGATNAMTGLLDAWQDNVPVIFISGQVKLKETTAMVDVPLRQFGVQEADIISVVKPLTKYAEMIKEAGSIAYHLEKAAHIAKTGRPGPVWLDIPQDIQGAIVDENNLNHYTPDDSQVPGLQKEDADFLLDAIHQAERPIVIAGNGIRLSGQVSEFRDFIKHHNLPTSVSYLGPDLLTQADPLYVGRLGNKGDRAGNFAVQNADLIISIGCRLSVALTGFEYQMFGREAQLVVIDIDANEHKKNTVRIDRLIHADVREFFKAVESSSTPARSEWIETCNRWKQSWPVSQDSYPEPLVNKYEFIKSLSDQMSADAVVVSDAGSSYYVASQALLINSTEQRYLTSGAQADMGFTLPAAIGACVARKNLDVIGITGDGSLQLNLQELQTVKHHGLPIKLFVWNNEGYLSIRATQRKFFEERYIGTNESSGVSFPDLSKIASAYGIDYLRIDSSDKLPIGIQSVLAHQGPIICEVFCPPDQEIIPAVSAMKKEDGSMVSKPMEDMYPYLPRDEFYENMIITPLDEE
jgi:acetolactate synthase-1/2/3 large subunit